MHQPQPREGAGVRWGVPACPPPAQLDWRRATWEVLEPAADPGVALRHRPDSDTAHQAAVSGRQLTDLQDHRGDLLQVQALLQATQRLGAQV